MFDLSSPEVLVRPSGDLVETPRSKLRGMRLHACSRAHKEGMRSTFAKAAAGRQARRGRRPLLLMTQEPIVGFANA
jgi:hypothetical protein